MKYKIGQKLKCIKNHHMYGGSNREPIFKQEEVYKIDDIREYGCGYYSIRGFYFYSSEEMRSYLNNHTPEVLKNGSTSGIQGVMPSDRLEDYFIDIKELRKQKLDKLNEYNRNDISKVS